MVKIAVIGLGYWGPNLVRNFYLRCGEGLRVCCDRDPGRLTKLAKTYPCIEFTTNVDAVLADKRIDAIALATPVATHFPLAKRAIEAGKSVLVEKPLTGNVAEAEELVDLARRKGVVLMVDHVFIYSPAVQMMKQMVDDGDLGTLQFIDSVRINLGMFQHDVNVVWDLAPHDLSIMDYIVGREPKSLSASGAIHARPDLEDVAYLNVDFGDGLIANFHVNWLSPVKIRYTMLGGSKKSLVYNDLDPVEKVKVYDSGITIKEDDPEDRRQVLINYRTGDVWSPRLPRTEPLSEVVSNFVECIEQEKKPLTDGEAGLRVVRLLDAAQRSIKSEGARIRL